MPTSPCTWPIDRSGFPALPANTDPGYQAALDVQFAMEDVAVTVLWALTGRQYGVCQTTVRPCADEHQPIDYLQRLTAYYGWMSWGIVDGGLGNLLGCGCGSGRCLLSGPSMVHLPGPVHPIDATHSVTVTIGDESGGSVLDPSDYVIEGDVLIRCNEKPWPYQNKTRPLGEPGTWSVQYWRGIPPPVGSGTFAGILAAELINAVTGGKCRLPKSVTRVSRQGVSYDIDPKDIYATGKTGIPEIDTWLAAVNPNALMQAPSVL